MPVECSESVCGIGAMPAVCTYCYGITNDVRYTGQTQQNLLLSAGSSE